MARTRKTHRLDLLAAFDERAFDHAILCTYTFDAPFFEGYCLERLASLTGHVSVLVDRNTYERAILSDLSMRPRRANLRYLLHPVAVPGVFHSKVSLFAGRDRARLIFGSANCTRAGLTSNAELVGCYDYNSSGDDHLLPLFRASYGFLHRLGERFPSRQLQENLEALLSDAPWIEPVDEPSRNGEFRLLDNLDQPLWDQIRVEVAAPVDTVYVVSRYFDRSPKLLDRIMNDLRPAKIVIYTQNGITSLTPDWLDYDSVANGRTEIWLCRYADDEQRTQPLHAKGIIIQKGRDRWFAFGSANFTSPALLASARTGNVETLLLLGPAVNRGLDHNIFDPQGSAVRLTRKMELQTCEVEDKLYLPAYDIRLLEASLDGEALSLNAAVPDGVTGLTAVISTYDGYVMNLRSGRMEGTAVVFQAPPEALGRFNESSAVVRLTGQHPDGSQAVSNPVLVSNIQFVDGELTTKRRRHIIDAQQSAAKFVNVLNDLLRGTDEQSLIDFLNLCDIPLTHNSPAPLLRRAKPIWDGAAGMRALGERNLKFYSVLHEAAIYFCERHLRKLQRHAKQPGPGGVANFLHIFLAAGNVLRAQMERMTQGLEGRGTPLNSEEWFACRTHADAYFDIFARMNDCLLNSYVIPLKRLYDPSQIRDEFRPDLQPLRELNEAMLAFRARIDQLRSAGGSLRSAGYFHSILGENRWPRYERKAQESIASVMKAVA
jgi:hypothetical protein